MAFGVFVGFSIYGAHIQAIHYQTSTLFLWGFSFMRHMSYTCFVAFAQHGVHLLLWLFVQTVVSFRASEKPCFCGVFLLRSEGDDGILASGGASREHARDQSEYDADSDHNDCLVPRQ